MAGFSVNYDEPFLDSEHDHPLLDFMDGLLGVEMMTSTTDTHPPNLWSQPDSTIWAASHNSLCIDGMPALDTDHQPRSMESFVGSQNKLTIREENPFVFNSPSFVLDHSQSVIDKSHRDDNLSTFINKTLGSENNHSKALLCHRIDTTPSGRHKRKNNQYDHDVNATVARNSTKKQSWKELEEEKCKRLKRSKYSQEASQCVKLDDNKKREGELPPKIVKKEAKEESCKDYIHVRARRGQATDSHSLAERVRREKIRERMKRLQELVPGCSKVTGKAQMLDEIINYVQSMQSQVEFLSVKLASVLRFCSFNIEIDGNGNQSEELLSLQRGCESGDNEVEQSQSEMPAVSLLY